MFLIFFDLTISDKQTLGLHNTAMEITGLSVSMLYFLVLVCFGFIPFTRTMLCLRSVLFLSHGWRFLFAKLLARSTRYPSE
ncbi:hypothetical protein FKM82_002404 [Ascaphus truei]